MNKSITVSKWKMKYRKYRYIRVTLEEKESQGIELKNRTEKVNKTLVNDLYTKRRQKSKLG